MQVHKYLPLYPLSNFIEHIVHVSGSLAVSHIKELPYGGINLVIELNENTVNKVFTATTLTKSYELKKAWISGVQKQAVIYQNNTNSTIISVRFTAGGFFALTKIPITDIHHVGICAESLLGNSFAKLYEKLINAASIATMFELICNYFLQYADDKDIEDSLVTFIHQNIERPIDWLIGKSGYSQKHVIHVLKKQTGFSPKVLQRINRFQSVVKEIQNQKEKIDWFTIIHRYGYFDQAHFIKDFEYFADIKPTDYLKSQMAVTENRLVSDMVLNPLKRKG